MTKEVEYEYVYEKSHDITYVWKHVTDEEGIDSKNVSSEVVGWYHDEPGDVSYKDACSNSMRAVFVDEDPRDTKIYLIDKLTSLRAEFSELPNPEDVDDDIDDELLDIINKYCQRHGLVIKFTEDSDVYFE